MATKPGFSFKGLKDTALRTRHNVTSKFGRGDTTVDATFNQEWERFTKNKKRYSKLKKDVEHYFKTLKELGSVHTSLMESCHALYEGTGSLSGPITACTKAQQNIEDNRGALENQLAEDVFKPLAEYVKQFKTLKARAEERNRRLTDMDRYKHEAKLLNEKNKQAEAHNFQHKYQCAKQGYEDLNKELLYDMDLLYKDRQVFFQYIFASFILAQASYFECAAQEYSQILNTVSYIDRSAIHHHPKVVREESAAKINPYTQPPPFQGAPQQSYQAPPQAYQPAYQPAQPYQPRGAAGGGGAPAPYQPQQQPSYHPPSQQSSPPGSRGLPPPPVARGGPSGEVAEAMYPFAAQSPAELSFQYGDRINILSKNGDWWEGELNGKRGLVPSNYVRLV